MSRLPKPDDHAATWVLPPDELAMRRKGEATETDQVRLLSVQQIEELLKAEKTQK